MTKHIVTQTTPFRTALRVPGTFPARPLERLLPFVQEWRARRNLQRTLDHLSDFYPRDVGLIKADVAAAGADNLNRSASRALKSAAQNRMSNW